MSVERALAIVCGELSRGFEMLERLPVSQWADRYRVLTRETSAVHGPWSTDRVPFMREVMDSLSWSDPIETVVLMKGSQIAGTEAFLNWIGSTIMQDPRSMLLVVPTDGFAKKYSKRRIRPMVRACAPLRELVGATHARGRGAGSTLTQIDFPNGSLVIASANSAAALSSDPIGMVVADEVDRWPRDVDKEGSPLALAIARTTTYPDRKLGLNSTPGLRETSQIEPWFRRGDMRRFYVACPHCGHEDFITWRGEDPFKQVEGPHFSIFWTPDHPESAELLCPSCGGLTPEHQKSKLFAAGQWRPTAQGDGHVRSYHLPGMYSPYGWLTWAKMAREFVHATREAARGATEDLQAFVNTRLGESWEEAAKKIEKVEILDRAEGWMDAPPEGVGAMIPNGVGVLTCSVDTQGDRLELLLQGWGAGEESWVLDHRRLDGDPDEDQVWFELDEYRARLRQHQSGRQMPILCTVIDSGGNKTDSVYAYCATRAGQRVYAVRGGTEVDKPLLGNPTRNNRYRVPLFTLCTASGKDRVFSRLQITRGPGRYHFPKALWFDEEFVAQLTAEKKVMKHVRGKGWLPEWKKIRNRNEVLDLCVYNLAALYILGREFVDGLGKEAARWAEPLADGEQADQPQATEPEPEQPRPSGYSVMPGGGWVNGWRTR